MPRDEFKANLSDELLQRHQILTRNIHEARKARGWSQDEAAKRCLISRGAYRAVESGNLGTAIGVYWAVLDCFGLAEGIEDLAAPHKDEVGRRLKTIKSKSGGLT
jgi:transcriptional regulator with XRE-family HTH domain